MNTANYNGTVISDVNYNEQYGLANFIFALQASSEYDKKNQIVVKVQVINKTQAETVKRLLKKMDKLSLLLEPTAKHETYKDKTNSVYTLMKWDFAQFNAGRPKTDGVEGTEEAVEMPKEKEVFKKRPPVVEEDETV